MIKCKMIIIKHNNQLIKIKRMKKKNYMRLLIKLKSKSILMETKYKINKI